MKNKITNLAIKDLKANKGRNKLTLLSITMAVFLIYVIMTVATSFHTQMFNEMKIADEDIVTIAFGAGKNALNYKVMPIYKEIDLENIKKTPDVSNVVGVKTTEIGALRTARNKSIFTSTIYGVDELYCSNLNLKLAEGRLPKGDTEVIIGNNVKTAANLKVGDKILVEGYYGDIELQLVGILEKQEEQAFSTLPTELNQMVAMSKDCKYFDNIDYMMIYAKIANVNKLESISNNILSNLNGNTDLMNKLEGTGLNTLVASKLDVLDMIDNWFTYINLFVGVLAILISFISAINIINIMAISIRDKFKDIAIYKIVGGTDGQVKGIFVRESIILGVLGSIIGIVLGIVVSSIAIKILNWPSGFNFTILIFALLLGIITAGISGYIVSKLAGKAEISIILNGE